jgi:hypothetical protein
MYGLCVYKSGWKFPSFSTVLQQLQSIGIEIPPTLTSPNSSQLEHQPNPTQAYLRQSRNPNHNPTITMDSTTQNKRTSTDNRRPVRPFYLSPHLPSPSHPFNQKPLLLTFQSKTVRRDVPENPHNEARPCQRQSRRPQSELRGTVHPQGRGDLGRHVEQVH